MTKHDEFDAAARAAHADAVERVSARVQAQLQLRRRAALSGRAAASQTLWPRLALGGTAVAALAVALTFGLRDTHESTETPAPNIATTANDPDGTPSPAPVDATDTHDLATNDLATHDTRDDAGIDRSAPVPISAPTTDETAVAAADSTMSEIDALLADEFDDATLVAANDDPLSAEFEENPDLYLWLGSDEGLADDSTELL